MEATAAIRSDILLAIIAAAGDKGLNRVQLQKVAFLVSDEFGGRLPDDFYAFGKHKFGPYSDDIRADTEMLLYWGCIRAEQGVEQQRGRYSIVDRCDSDTVNIASDIRQYIKETVDWVIDMSFGEVVRAVYRLYPEYRDNSVFRYDEEEAEVEAFERSIRQMKEGKVYSARERLKELRDMDRANG